MKYALSITLFVLAVYVGAYFVVLSLPSRFHFRKPAGSAVVIETKYVFVNGELIADYHGIPESAFAPIHALNKKYLRPAYWFIPRDQTMSFGWMTGNVPASKTSETR